MDLGYAGLKSTELEGNELELDWTGLSRTGVRKTELDGSAFHWAGLSYSEA